VPPQFKILVDILRNKQADGVHRPNWASLGTPLLAKDTGVYKKAGANKLSKYLTLAQEAGIIQSDPRWEWVSLTPEWGGKQV
jgi:hypothetical protein